jgi:hypothetical protein
MKKEKQKKEKKPTVHRGPSQWNLHVAKIRAENPGMKSGELYKLAKTTYVKLGDKQ